MARKSDFPIHVDSSCLTDSTDLKMPSKHDKSDNTVVHNEIEDIHSETDESLMDSQLSQVSHDEHTEALIHAAACAVVASMEQDGYGQEDSVLSMKSEEGYEGGTEHTYGGGMELAYGDSTEHTYDSDTDHSHHDPYDGSGSSHHEDDVFSQGNSRSNRSSLNSCTDEEEHMKHAQENENEQEHDHHFEEELHDHHQPISRMPSTASNACSLLPEPLTLTFSPHTHTPSKILSRPPFRTPSSVRAMQMSSPTPSIFSGSPRASKRPTVSRLGTPTGSPTKSSTNKTPTRFKAKKEQPLVLLHVTVLPLHWPSGEALDTAAATSEGVPREFHCVRDSWKLLREKLGDMVLERGILLSHPQDEYEVLEERLLDALELPVRPRAKILSCGHYLGPDDAADMSSDDGSGDEEEGSVASDDRERWCDICGREARYSELGLAGRQKRFRVKVYASNGLMRAGAWAAAWREMERVDVEIEPFVPSHLAPLLGSFIRFHAQQQQQPASPPPMHHQAASEQYMHVDHDKAEQLAHVEVGDDTATRKHREEERIREIYGGSPPPPPPQSMLDHEVEETMRAHKMPPRPAQRYGDSLPELLWEAVKVVLRDKKQVAICILSFLVVILAIRPLGTSTQTIIVPRENTTTAGVTMPPQIGILTAMPARAAVAESAPALEDEMVSGDAEVGLVLTTPSEQEEIVVEALAEPEMVKAVPTSPELVVQVVEDSGLPLTPCSEDVIVNESSGGE